MKNNSTKLDSDLNAKASYQAMSLNEKWEEDNNRMKIYGGYRW